MEHLRYVFTDSKFRQRKFFALIFFSWVITIALFADKLSGGEFITGMTLLLSVYGAQAHYGSLDDKVEKGVS